MAFQYAIVPFQIPAGAAPQSLVLNFVDAITGAAFTPKGWVFLGNRVDTGNGVAQVDWRIGLGSPNRQMSFSYGAGVFLSGNNVQDYWSTNHLQTSVRNTAINQFINSGYLSSVGNGTATFLLDATGLAASAGGDRSAILFIGGDDVEAYADYYQATTITAPGFRPTGVIGYHNPGVPSTGVIGIGAMAGISFASDECGSCALVVSQDNGNPIEPTSVILEDVFAPQLSQAGVVTSSPAISMTATGFNVTAGPGTHYVPYLAFNGCAVNIVTFEQPQEAGTQTIPITMANPRVVMFATISKNTIGSVQPDCFLGLSVADTDQQFSFWSGSEQSSHPFQDDTRYTSTHAITSYTTTGSDTSTLNSSATLTVLGNGYIELEWDLVDGTEKKYVAFILGDDLGTGPCGEPLPSGTVVVTKETDPDGSATVFNVTSSSALGGGSFTLIDGQTRTFTNVPAGSGYSVVEDPLGQWEVSYNVSTAELNTNFTVTEDQTTTIDILNTRVVPPSGETVQWRLHRFDIKKRQEEIA